MTPEASFLRALLHFVLATYQFLQPSYDPPSSSARPTPTTAAGPASTLYPPVPTVLLASWPSVDLVELVWTPGHEKENAIAVEKRQDGSPPQVTSNQVEVDGQQFMQTITVTSMCVLPAFLVRATEREIDFVLAHSSQVARHHDPDVSPGPWLVVSGGGGQLDGCQLHGQDRVQRGWTGRGDGHVGEWDTEACGAPFPPFPRLSLQTDLTLTSLYSLRQPRLRPLSSR